MDVIDKRRPNPPIGYSRRCRLSLEQQVSLVAEFHANKIRPSRIAYRLGIDIAIVESWLAGEKDRDLFFDSFSYHKKRRYRQQLTVADGLRGQRAYDLRTAAKDGLDAE